MKEIVLYSPVFNEVFAIKTKVPPTPIKYGRIVYLTIADLEFKLYYLGEL